MLSLALLGDADTQAYLASVVDDWVGDLVVAADASASALAAVLREFVDCDDHAILQASTAIIEELQASGAFLHLPTTAPPTFEATFVPPQSCVHAESRPTLPAAEAIANVPAAAAAPPPPPPVDAFQAEQAWAAALDDTDDFATAWAECLATGRSWGGRGFGGRGIARQYNRMTHATRDVSVDGITMSFGGHELLTRTTLRLTHGHRYALLGRNGVGKSTLLRRIAAGRLPGFPPHLKVQYMMQDLPLSSVLGPEAGHSAIEYLVEGASARQRRELLTEKEELEQLLGPPESATRGAADEMKDIDVPAVAQRLGDLEATLADLADDSRVRQRAKDMLTGLGFSAERMADPVSILSGGWRVRLALAASLLSEPDILLLDEPSSHLDLHAVLWLEHYLTHNLGGGCGGGGGGGGGGGTADPEDGPLPAGATTLLFVSHDRDFVAAVATDIIIFEKQQLRAFHGDFAAFEEKEQERTTAHAHRLNARVRQETAARASAEKMQSAAKAKTKGSGDNLLRAAKQKLAKVERVGLFRDDGKYYQLNSLKTLDEEALRLPERVEAQRAAREDVFTFPAPNWTGLRGAAAGSGGVLLRLDNVSCGYAGGRPILNNMTAHISRGDRIAVVGRNGAGKSTLMKLLLGNAAVQCLSGEVHRAQNLRVAYAPQHHTEALAAHASESAAALCVAKFKCSELDARGRLGKFGLKGDSAVLPLGLLSGGQKVRVSLAILTWDAPHVLMLDEVGIDGFALDALAAALLAFEGAVLLVSHNRAFTTAVCVDLWVVEDGGLTIHRGTPDGDGAGPDAHTQASASFGTLFADYAASVVRRGGDGGAAASQRRATSRMAAALDKAADANRKGARSKAAAGQRTALL